MPSRRSLASSVVVLVVLACGCGPSVPASKTVADIRTTLRRRADGDFVLDGEKFYCTGSLLAHWLTVLAKDEDGRTRVAIVPREAERS